MPSSVIRLYRYHPARRELTVVFQSGERYTYRRVPEATYRALNAADSKGPYFNAHIRDRFEFVRHGKAVERGRLRVS